jgi:hypothetical protein
MDVEWDEGSRIQLLDSNTVGRSYCQLSGSSVLEFRFNLDSLLYACIFDDMYTQFRFAPDLLDRNVYVCWVSSKYLHLTDVLGITAKSKRAVQC